MNCNKKSHFDAATSVPWQEGDLVMSLFARGDQLPDCLLLTDTQKERERLRVG